MKPPIEAAEPVVTKTMTGIVARGRSVSLAGKQHLPGTVLELTEADFLHLLAHGFLVDARREPIEPGDGSVMGVVGGVVRPR